MQQLIRAAWVVAVLSSPAGAALAQPTPAAPAPAAPAAPPGLDTLITATPAEGFDLAMRLARRAVPMMQRDGAVRGELRQHYSHDAGELIEAAHVVAIHFQTVAAANNYWRRP